MSRNKRNRNLSYADVYRSLNRAQLNTWLLLVFLLPVTLPNIAIGIAYQNWLNLGIAIFGCLGIYGAIKSLVELRRQKKRLLENPEAYLEHSSCITQNDQRPLFWFNKF